MATPGELADPTQLTERHLGLVKSIALKLHGQLPPQVELDDLIGYGTQGMLEAAQRFDPSRGVTFATFAYYRVRGAMFDGLRRSGQMRRRDYARARLAERADAYLENAAAREEGADPADRARRTTADTLSALSEHVAALTTIYVTSLDALARPEVPDDQAVAPFEQLDAVGLNAHLSEALASLEERERRMVELCYYQNHSIREASEVLGVSKSWASRIHGRAIHKLQCFMAQRDQAIEPPRGPPPG
jgi:RNA polymerase sigma factor for flagellar operon FliA